MPTPLPPSTIWNRQVDTPVVQDSSYRFDKNDRSYLDSQIRGSQQHIVASLVTGIHASWYPLDPNVAVPFQPGDVVCASASVPGSIVLATAANLATAGEPLGVVLEAAPLGSVARVALKGILPPSITGLPTAGNQLYAIVNTTTGRITTAATILSSAYALGTVTATGNLSLNIQLPPQTGTISLSITGTGIVHVTANAVDATTYLGTAGQALFTNAAANDTAWASISGDVSASTSTPGLFTVTGIQTHAVPAPSGTATVLTWNAGGSGAFSWAAAGGSTTITGTGIAHVTSSAIDGTAYKGTAGQFLTTGAGATDTAWATITVDISASTSTPGALTVVGLRGNALPSPSGTGTVLTWTGSALAWGASTGFTVTGTGIAHITSSALDGAAYKGTAGQALFTAAGATDTSWATITVDVSASTSTPGAFTVVGIRGNSVPSPSGTNTVLQWSGSAFSWASIASGSVTWANDLVHSTSTNQYVSALSFDGTAAGGDIAINGTSTRLVWAQNAFPQYFQGQQANGSQPFNMVFLPQRPGALPTNTANGTPGSLLVQLGAPTGTGNEASFRVARDSYGTLLRVQSDASTTSTLIYNGVTAAGTPTSSNFMLQTVPGTRTVLNDSTQVSVAANASVIANVTANGLSLFGGNSTGFAGSTGAIWINNASALPTSNPPAGSGLLFVTSTGTINWRNAGGIQWSTNFRTVAAASYTIDASNIPDGTIYVDTTSNTVTLTLPVPNGGRRLYIVDKTGNFQNNACILAPHATEKINRVAGNRALVAQDGRYWVDSDGTDWYTN